MLLLRTGNSTQINLIKAILWYHIRIEQKEKSRKVEVIRENNRGIRRPEGYPDKFLNAKNKKRSRINIFNLRIKGVLFPSPSPYPQLQVLRDQDVGISSLYMRAWKDNLIVAFKNIKSIFWNMPNQHISISFQDNQMGTMGLGYINDGNFCQMVGCWTRKRRNG